MTLDCSWISFFFSLSFFIDLVDITPDSSRLFAISAWANTSSSSFYADPIISLSLALNASLLTSFYFSSVSFACSWTIFSFSLSSFTVRVDSASDISSLLEIPSWARSFLFSFPWADRISLSLALGPSVLLSFSFYFNKIALFLNYFLLFTQLFHCSGWRSLSFL